MAQLFEFEEFDDENPQAQVLELSNLLNANWQQRDAEWKMHSVCPPAGLRVTSDGSVIFDSIAYHNQSGYKWSQESIWFSVTDKKDEEMYIVMKGTFSV
jgi:hypothetical protein